MKIVKTPLILSILFLCGSMTAFAATGSLITITNTNIANPNDIQLHVANGSVSGETTLPTQGKRNFKFLKIDTPNLASLTTWELIIKNVRRNPQCTVPAQPAGNTNKASVTVTQTSAGVVPPTYSCTVVWN
jgi:hypothetical protein